MPLENRDLALLWDMREAAGEIREFTQDTTFAHFASNKVLRYAVERQILVIGEAANHVSDRFKQAHPEIPWNGIIGQRNILAHEYAKYSLNAFGLLQQNAFPS